jgi:hypothetical protein
VNASAWREREMKKRRLNSFIDKIRFLNNPK